MRKIVPACAFYSDLETGAGENRGNAREIHLYGTVRSGTVPVNPSENDVQTTGYGAKGAIAFILPYAPLPPLPPYRLQTLHCAFLAENPTETSRRAATRPGRWPRKNQHPGRKHSPRSP